MMINFNVFLLFFEFLGWAICEQKLYYIATEEVSWNYAPSRRFLVNEDERLANYYLEPRPEIHKPGHVYSKITYTEYTDNSFTSKNDSASYLGFLGPILRVNVGDELVVMLKNRARFNVSIHPHGIPYDKLNEGSTYGGHSGVAPGATYRYTWNITEESGPADGTGCVSHLYHSDVDFIRDVNTGLLGFILVCAKDEDTEPGNDIFLHFGITDENLSLMSNNTDVSEEANRMHAINGYVYGNMPKLSVCVGTKTRFHIGSLSSSDDIHSIRFFGHAFSHKGKRLDVLPIFSGKSLTAELVPSEKGAWLLSSMSRMHIEGGMQILITVEDCGKPRPKINIATKIRKYFISAEETIWDGKQRSVFVGYTNRQFKQRLPRGVAETYLGALGPVLKAAVGDVLKIVFYNKLNRTLSIRPAGLRTSKQYEGIIYNDTIKDKIQTAPGEKRTYYWFVPEYLGPEISEDLCIPRYYTADESTLFGPILVCQQYALDDSDNQIIPGNDLFLFMLESRANSDGINGFEKDSFPSQEVCTGQSSRLHFLAFTSRPVSIMSDGDSFEVDGSFVSTVGLVPYLPNSVKLTHTTEGIRNINSYPDASFGFAINVSDCGSFVSNEEFNDNNEIMYIGISKEKWSFVGRAISTTKWRQTQTGEDKMGPIYWKAIYGYYFQNFARPDVSRRLSNQGYIGHVFYTSVGETLKISFRNDADRDYAIFTPGVIADYTSALPPGNTQNITWKIPQNIGPGSGDAECVAKAYFSNLNISSDISTGLVGPLIICRRGFSAQDFKHTIIFFGEVDENMSWYFKESVVRFGPKTNISLIDTNFMNNNRIKVINGMSDGTIPVVRLDAGKSHFLHFFNIGFRFQSIHLSGIIFPKTNSLYLSDDVLGLHPGTSTTVQVTPKITGEWRLMGYGTDKYWNEMSAIINVPTSTGGAN